MSHSRCHLTPQAICRMTIMSRNFRQSEPQMRGFTLEFLEDKLLTCSLLDVPSELSDWKYWSSRVLCMFYHILIWTLFDLSPKCQGWSAGWTQNQIIVGVVSKDKETKMCTITYIYIYVEYIDTVWIKIFLCIQFRLERFQFLESYSQQ